MITILYVENDMNLLWFGKKILERNEDFRIDTSISVTEAVEKAKKNSYDVIVAEYDISPQNGVEFHKKIRSEIGDTPFILFTSREQDEVIPECFVDGVDYYLQKSGKGDQSYIRLTEVIRQAAMLKLMATDARENITHYQYAESVAKLGHWTFHPGSGVVTCSQGILALFGLDGCKWSIRDLWQMSLPEYNSVLSTMLKGLFYEKKPINYKFKIKRKKDGYIRELHLIAEYHAARDKIFGIIQDITAINSETENSDQSTSSLCS